MRCPKCGTEDDKVIDSRSSKDGMSIRRRRECVSCGNRYTTYEEIERTELKIVKRDGRREPFDRYKLLAGITKACEKRPVSAEQLEETAQQIAEEVETEFGREIPSRVIGAKVMERLHGLDEVAYVRYASVYRHFQDIGEFISEIQALERKVKFDSSQAELFPGKK